MTIFFKRSRNKSTPINEKQIELSEYNVSINEDQYTDLFECTATLKIWLPESIENQLSEISYFLDVSVSDFIRQIIFVHLYGRYAFLGCVEREIHHFDEKAFMPKVCYAKSVSPQSTGQTTKEKLVSATKIYLPQRMKDDLLSFAETKYQPVSEYCRQLIITHLHGQKGVFPEKPSGLDEGFV
jgi:hypothetical protein